MADDSPAAAADRLLKVGRIFSTSAGLMPLAHAVGKGGRTEANAVAADVAGGDRRLSHLGRRGARLGMSYTPSDGGARVTMVLKPPGAWVLVEKGAVPHQIGRPRGKPRFLYSQSYGHPVRAPIPHPGAKGKGAIRRTFARIRARTGRDAHAEVVRQLKGIYG